MYVCTCVYLCVCVCVVCVFYSCISGCLGCYNILTTIYRVTMNTDNYPEGGFLDHMVVLCVIFWKTSILFSTVAALLCITTNSIQGLQFLHIIANTCCHLFFVFCFFLMTAILAGMSDISLWFPLAFSCKSNGTLVTSNILFSCTCWSFVMSSPEKCLFKSLAHFNWAISSFHYWVVGVPYIFWSLTPYLIYNLRNVPPFCKSPIRSIDCFRRCEEAF